jgi:DNA-binding response OmpR family regulator
MDDDGAMTQPASGPARAVGDRAVRVLIVDDERAFASVVGSYFTRDGYQVSLAHDGPAAVAEAERLRPHLVLLDLMLPGFDGVEVCRRLRVFSDAYVLMLTARGADVDKIVGLGVGADDYVVKPASPRELLARASALLRRPRAMPGSGPALAGEEPMRAVGDLVLDPVARTVSLEQVPVELTRTEFDLLAALMARPRAAFTRGQLVEAVWGPGWYGDEHVVDVHVGHLRRKLGDDATAARYVRTVRGIGYGLGAGTAPGPDR